MTLVQPSPEQQLHIRSELNEDVNTRDSDLAHIREWLSRQPHLPDWQDDARIMTFLRGCKFSLEKTKRKLDMYFTMRAAVPEFFSNRDPTLPEIKEVMRVVNVPPLPGLTKNGRRVTIMKAVDMDNIGATVADAMKVVLMIGDIRLKEEQVGVAGDVYILDAAVATPQNFAQHFAKFTPTLLRKFFICVQEAYPVKVKEVHVINVSPLVDKLINFVKPILKEKLRERIRIHSDMNSLYEFVDKEILPEEYGGSAGPLAEINRQWSEKMASYRQWFMDEENIKTDESKRPGKPKTQDDLFGVEGSFKQLSID